MGMKASVRYATARLVEFTGLVFLVVMALGLGNTVGTAAFAWAGSTVQESLFPVLAPIEVAHYDAKTGTNRIEEMPAFQITGQQWYGKDLLLARGTLCKAQDYDFVDARIAYGTPTGVFQPAKIVFLSADGPRTPGCQTWRNWLLVDAKTAISDTWFLVLKHRPRHGLWTVRQTLGPFPLPDRSSAKAG